jgi:hypothetical protein
MRLCKKGLSSRFVVSWAMSCALLSAVASAAPQRGDFGGVAAESTMTMMSATTLVDARAERFAASLVPEFSSQKATSADRIHLAYAPMPLSPMRSADPVALAPQVAEQPPSFWLMGGVTLFLIAYQLRRKHRLLRPHRFHEL